MKYVILIIDGMADFPIKKMGNITPIEAANIPNLDFLARNGKTGIMQTCFSDLPIGSIVANMGILGFDPLKYYPHGRASFEALAKKIYLDKNDIAFRCNLITLENEKIKSSTCDLISDELAQKIIDNISIKQKNIELYHSQGYRNILVLRNVNFSPNEIICSEPHQNIGINIDKLFIKGKTKKGKNIADMLNNFMKNSREQMKNLNKIYKSKADILWLWSPSSTPTLPSFFKTHKISGSVVTGLDFLKGMALASEMKFDNILGATGESDTNLNAKLKNTMNNLKKSDLVYIHINAPDEESHQGSYVNKTKIIEKIDKEFLGPLLNYLNKNYSDNFIITVLPDHYTLTEKNMHLDKDVPFVVFGKNIEKDKSKIFSEKSIEKTSDFHIKSSDLISFLKQKGEVRISKNN